MLWVNNTAGSLGGEIGPIKPKNHANGARVISHENVYPTYVVVIRHI